MLRYTARRLLSAAATLAGVLASVFALLSFAPGDPAALALRSGRGAAVASAPEAVAAFRAAYGLDRPLPERFRRWVLRAATLDFGRSFRDGRPVMEKVAASLPVTLVLNGAALLLALAAGVPAGVLAALGPGGRLDRRLCFAADVLFAAPSFAVGTLLALVFAVELGWLPVFADPALGPSSFLLPVATLALVSIAPVVQVVRGSLRPALAAPSALADRARGLGRRAVVGRAFRRCAVPLTGLLASLASQLVAGSILVERLFGVGGTGELMATAVFSRDLPTVLALTLLSGLAVVAASVAADLVAVLLDPRLSAEAS